jgi:hypothetical protein
VGVELVFGNAFTPVELGYSLLNLRIYGVKNYCSWSGRSVIAIVPLPLLSQLSPPAKKIAL